MGHHVLVAAALERRQRLDPVAGEIAQRSDRAGDCPPALALVGRVVGEIFVQLQRELAARQARRRAGPAAGRPSTRHFGA